MNELMIFTNPEFGNIRTIERDGTPWFVGKDVAEALGYAKPRNAIDTHVDPDDALKQGVTDSMGRTQEMTIINESGLYALVLGSKLPTAKKFKRWVTSEVLPSIRKNGMYLLPKDYPSALRALADSEEQRMALAILMDPAIQVATLVGQAGSGKTLLALAAALECTLQRNLYDRILVSRPIIPMGNDLGYLPGSKDEKLDVWMQPIYDNLDFLLRNDKHDVQVVRRQIDELKRSRKLELEAWVGVEPTTYGFANRSLSRSSTTPSNLLLESMGVNIIVSL